MNSVKLQVVLMTNDNNDGKSVFVTVVPLRGDTFITPDVGHRMFAQVYRVTDIRHELRSDLGQPLHTITLVLEIKQ
jgi:hypothetical protein